MDHDKIEAVLKKLDHLQQGNDLLPFSQRTVEAAADLIRDLRTENGNQETKIVDLEEKVESAAEPAAWQSRVRIGGNWSKWREIDGDLGEQKKRMASMAEQGKFEVRPLYIADNAALIAAVPALVEALENILRAELDFRSTMPPDWEGDPLQSACDVARAAFASIGRAQK